MSGPIVRSGASARYSENWANIFGSAKSKKAKPKAAKKSAKKKSAKKKK
jgi:hypothetical protein